MSAASGGPGAVAPQQPSGIPEPAGAALRPETRARIGAAVAAAQRDWRAPNVSAGVVRDGVLVHSEHVGAARLSPHEPADDDTRWLIGSVTKTFTAVLVMALKDEGRLELGDRVGDHLALADDTDPAVRAMTIHQLLGHVSGLQREVEGRMWESLRAPGAGQLLADLARVRPVLPARERFHYSNYAYALLGLIVEQVDGRPWEQAVTARVLQPLGMTRTVVDPGSDRAEGYFVHPWSGVAHPEPVIDLGATVPMGGLWSTLTDLSRYAAFLAGSVPGILAPATLELMSSPVVIVDPLAWTMGHGLGLGLARRGERVYVGHGGAMPGFLTGLRVSPAEGVGAVVWTNSSAGAAPLVLAADLLDIVLDAEPARPAAWVPEADPGPLQELLGSWWSEGDELLFTVREGSLWCSVRGWESFYDSRFEAAGPDCYRVVAGRECGELLQLARDRQGRIERMYFASYPVTRQPLPFGGS